MTTLTAETAAETLETLAARAAAAPDCSLARAQAQAVEIAETAIRALIAGDERAEMYGIALAQAGGQMSGAVWAAGLRATARQAGHVWRELGFRIAELAVRAARGEAPLVRIDGERVRFEGGWIEGGAEVAAQVHRALILGWRGASIVTHWGTPDQGLLARREAEVRDEIIEAALNDPRPPPAAFQVAAYGAAMRSIHRR